MFLAPLKLAYCTTRVANLHVRAWKEDRTGEGEGMSVVIGQDIVYPPPLPLNFRPFSTSEGGSSTVRDEVKKGKYHLIHPLLGAPTHTRILRLVPWHHSWFACCSATKIKLQVTIVSTCIGKVYKRVCCKEFAMWSKKLVRYKLIATST